MTEVAVQYDLEMDVYNFIRGLYAKNNRRPTTLQQLYMQTHGADYSKDQIREFLCDQHHMLRFDPLKITKKVLNQWRPVEFGFFSRADALFGITFPLNYITAYISTNQRCTYNIAGEYFFLYAYSPSFNSIIMHEIFHFYTQYAFGGTLLAGTSATEYNTVKESLTELLNIEFLDCMLGARDEGYPQHSYIRNRIRQLWLERADIKLVVSEALAVSKSMPPPIHE